MADGANDRTGKRVGLRQSANPVLLLSGYAHFRDWNIPTSVDGNFRFVPHLLQPNGKANFAPGNQRVERIQFNMKHGTKWIPLPLVATEMTTPSSYLPSRHHANAGPIRQH